MRAREAAPRARSGHLREDGRQRRRVAAATTQGGGGERRGNPPPPALRASSVAFFSLSPNGEWRNSSRCHTLGRVCPAAVLPDRALYSLLICVCPSFCYTFSPLVGISKLTLNRLNSQVRGSRTLRHTQTRLYACLIGWIGIVACRAGSSILSINYYCGSLWEEVRREAFCRSSSLY